MKNNQNYGEELDRQFEEGIVNVFKSEDAEKSGEDSFGKAGLVCGILGLFTIPIIFSTLAVVFGVIAMDKKQRYGKTSFVIGIIGLTLMLVMMFYFAAAFGSAIASLLWK